MKVFTDIQTATAHFHGVSWPQDVPHPAIGDSLVWRSGNVAWVFQVTKRHIQIGTDPQTGDPQARVMLTVDSEPPEGFRM